MPEISIPDLSFPGVNFGPQETPWNLQAWLHRNGAAVPINKVNALVQSGSLGHPLPERIELVFQIREILLNYLQAGGRRQTVRSCLEKLKIFFTWADQYTAKKLSLSTAEEMYRHWCDDLIHRVRVKRELKEITAHSYGSRVGWVLDRILERDSALIKSTRLKKQNKAADAISPKAEKQNLEETFKFGHFLMDLADGLSVEAIWGDLPLHIPIRNGKTLIEASARLRTPKITSPNPKYLPQMRYQLKKSEKKRIAWQNDKSFRTRYPLINLRIIAEMFMLMAQPGVNLAQVSQLRMDQWRFKPSTNGYEIRTYKHRRWGPVVFDIYSEYRPIFERYLHWRKTIFPDDPDGLLFPLLGNNGEPTTRRLGSPARSELLKRAAARAGVVYINPSTLRNTNVNWMLRRSGDPDLTADEKQHSKKTLLSNYERPSLQRTIVQTQLFWTKYDPALAAAGPGLCLGEAPTQIKDTLPTATKPDCVTPAGCFFCEHQRDVNSFDYAWSLATFRLLKTFELGPSTKAETIGTELHPAILTIERITAKLDEFEKKDSEGSKWVKEALLRIEEERYHPAWAGQIESL